MCIKGADLALIEEETADRVTQKVVGTGQATLIMTGAPIPSGADAVVMIERTRRLDAACVKIDGAVSPGQNILPQAKEMRRGEVVLMAGARLRPQEVGLLALVGRLEVVVHPRP